MQEKAIHMLEEAGIQASYQRIKVMNALLESRKHPTADEIHRRLQQEVPAISRTTVYNTLNLLADRDVVDTIVAERGETRYDVVSQPHGHFVCRVCHRIEDIPFDYPDQYVGLDDYLVESEKIVLKGVCRDCRAKTKSIANDSKEESTHE